MGNQREHMGAKSCTVDFEGHSCVGLARKMNDGRYAVSLPKILLPAPVLERWQDAGIVDADTVFVQAIAPADDKRLQLKAAADDPRVRRAFQVPFDQYAFSRKDAYWMLSTEAFRQAIWNIGSLVFSFSSEPKRLDTSPLSPKYWMNINDMPLFVNDRIKHFGMFDSPQEILVVHPNWRVEELRGLTEEYPTVRAYAEAHGWRVVGYDVPIKGSSSNKRIYVLRGPGDTPWVDGYPAVPEPDPHYDSLKTDNSPVVASPLVYKLEPRASEDEAWDDLPRSIDTIRPWDEWKIFKEER